MPGLKCWHISHAKNFTTKQQIEDFLKTLKFEHYKNRVDCGSASPNMGIYLVSLINFKKTVFKLNWQAFY